MDASLRKRLVSGLSLTGLILAFIFADMYLASIPDPPEIWLFDGRFDLGFALYNGLLSTLVVLVLTLLTIRELMQFARVHHAEPFATVVYFFSCLMVLGPYLAAATPPYVGFQDEAWGTFTIAIALGVSFFRQAARQTPQNAMMNIGFTTFILFYAGGLAGFMPKLRMEIGGSQGMLLLLISLVVIKITDTGAYFSGRAFGRHKLVPWLSPAKTWEGFFGGLTAALVVALAIGSGLHFSGVDVMSGWLSYPFGWIFFGVLMALASVAGDLCASLIKRDVAVKDSSDTIPGMGGVLDIVDSPLLGAPVAWFFWTRVVKWAAT